MKILIGLAIAAVVVGVVSASAANLTVNSGALQQLTLPPPTELQLQQLTTPQSDIVLSGEPHHSIPTITLRWNAVAGAVSYNIYQSRRANDPMDRIANTTETAYDDRGKNGKGVEENGLYYYVVRAVFKNNVEGTPSNILEILGPPPEATPTPSATAASAAAAARTATPASARSASTATLTPTGADSSRASTATRTRTPVPTRTATPKAAALSTSVGSQTPVGPANLRASVGGGKVNLTWSAVTGAQSYVVSRSTAPGGAAAIIGSATMPSFSDGAAVAGTTYYYTVTAVLRNGSGTYQSQPSSEVKVTAGPGN